MKHFLDVADHSPDEIQDILDVAIKLKRKYFAGLKARCWR
jgi:ornithine carbamoyltransferase